MEGREKGRKVLYAANERSGRGGKTIGGAGWTRTKGDCRNGNRPETVVQLPCNYILFLILLI